jgi:predicted S18 family serine protease
MVKLIAAVLVFTLVFFVIGLLFELPTPTKYVETKIVYQTVPEYINTTIEVPVGQIYEKNITVYGVAIYNDSVSGELVGIDLILEAGSGGTFLDVSDKTFGTDLQETLPLIKAYAQSFTHQNLAYKDLVVRIRTAAENIQGTSGGAAMAVGLIAMLQNKILNSSIIVTGSMNPDGTLASVNSLNLKIAVARNLGVREILVPKVQCGSVNASITGITVACVNSVQEALNIMAA